MEEKKKNQVLTKKNLFLRIFFCMQMQLLKDVGAEGTQKSVLFFSSVLWALKGCDSSLCNIKELGGRRWAGKYGFKRYLQVKNKQN